MHSSEINGDGELRVQPANPGSPGNMSVKTECVCGCVTAKQLNCDKHLIEDGLSQV